MYISFTTIVTSMLIVGSLACWRVDGGSSEPPSVARGSFSDDVGNIVGKCVGKCVGFIVGHNVGYVVGKNEGCDEADSVSNSVSAFWFLPLSLFLFLSLFLSLFLFPPCAKTTHIDGDRKVGPPESRTQAISSRDSAAMLFFLAFPIG